MEGGCRFPTGRMKRTDHHAGRCNTDGVDHMDHCYSYCRRHSEEIMFSPGKHRHPLSSNLFHQIFFVLSNGYWDAESLIHPLFRRTSSLHFQQEKNYYLPYFHFHFLAVWAGYQVSTKWGGENWKWRSAGAKENRNAKNNWKKIQKNFRLGWCVGLSLLIWIFF